ncbi:MAG: 50S ribosomal protein L37Ae [Archaeoglobales archaeon]|nr:50S ribosomal protein L37Ae [Archaeoglobales archaeon]TDA27249.1 MAG: 50S ribosomal protein L37ae [Archaeoglobi archaeon]TDA27273.1 MAG: 50S ribosomal protein L37ae [Archaeoglobi archaeon]TDA29582.1 MAG: 50S ribosomal protein L37ae [Archaeoglobi archaeon]
MARTKKVKSAAKFRASAGLSVRRKWLEIDIPQRQKYVCKRCGKRSVKRVGSGIWECRSCGYKFAGGCYLPSTVATKIIEKEKIESEKTVVEQ